MKNRYLLIIVIILLELAARSFYHPFRFTVLPEEKENALLKELEAKETLSIYDYDPSDSIRSEVREYRHGEQYTQTILPDQSRYTGNIIADKTFDVYGCSYCFGIGLEDTASLGYKLQLLADDFTVKNHCQIAAGFPVYYANYVNKLTDSTKRVVINYCNFHQERKPYSRWLSKTIARSQTKKSFQIVKQKMVVPSIEDDTLIYIPIKPIKLGLVRYSVLANLIDAYFIQKREYSQDDVKSTARILEKIHHECKEKGIEFVVNNGDGHEKTKEHFERFSQYDIPLLDLNISTGDATYGLSETDGHPNELANELFAKGIKEYFDRLDTKLSFE